MAEKREAAPAADELVTITCACGALVTLNKNRPAKPEALCGACGKKL